MADGNLGSQVPLPNEEEVDFDLFGPSASLPGIGSAGGSGPGVSAQAAGSAAGSPQQQVFPPQQGPSFVPPTTLRLLWRNSFTQPVALQHHAFRTRWHCGCREMSEVVGLADLVAHLCMQSEIRLWSRRSCIQCLVECCVLRCELWANVLVQNLLSGLLSASCLLPELRQEYLPVRVMLVKGTGQSGSAWSMVQRCTGVASCAL